MNKKIIGIFLCMLILFAGIPVAQAVNPLLEEHQNNKTTENQSTLGGGVFSISYLFGSLQPGRLYDENGNMYRIANLVLVISPHDGGAIAPKKELYNKVIDVGFISGDRIYRHAYVKDGPIAFEHIFIGHLGPFFCCGIYIVIGGVP
jgi:hypothetical protein